MLPSRTRQGTYAAAPSGILLASINSSDPERMAEMLRQALARWESMSRTERLLPDGPSLLSGEATRGERFYPADGLVLRVIEGLSAEEVGELMGRTAGAVRMLQMRALTALREVISEPEA